ncbi:acyl-CoA synthetase [Guyparkeria hydrothermalis]|uniref:LpxL/LpxP family acyltransferase n=1 Tax=Guyparkeria hydrothermalis TaxID=923 RepID=UPI00202032F0|nr:acyl-CoA synthetase [Guyparkeria hydrothermalis]MCL7743813.1 acyl-CoA synthetase [Guyparkeria hydrothermalis]
MSKNVPRWQSGKERGHQGLMRLMVFLSLRLGRRITRHLLVPISLYFLLFVPEARRASRSFLGHVHGRPARITEVFDHIHHFASTIHDRVYFLNGRFEAFDIRVVGRECFDPPEPAILVGAHFGSFDALRASAWSERDLPITMMMYPENARKIQRVLNAINPERAGDIIELGQIDSMIEADHRLRQGHLVGMLADRSLATDPMAERLFLGAPASFAEGPFRMAALLRQRVLVMAGIYLGDNRYEVRFEPIADFRDITRGERRRAIDAAMDRYVARLESLVREHPTNWFNFFDFWASDESHSPTSTRGTD